MGERRRRRTEERQQCLVADSKNIWRLKTKKPRQLFLAGDGKETWDQR